MNKWKSALFTGIRIAIGVGILVWLFVRFDFSAAWQAGSHANQGLMWLSFLLFLLPPIVIQPYKFLWMVNQLRPHSMGLIVKLSLLGYFFNQFLPTSIGGDAVKVVWLSRKFGQWKAYMVAAVADRMSGALVLFTGLVGYLWWIGAPIAIPVAMDGRYLWIGVPMAIAAVWWANKAGWLQQLRTKILELKPYFSGQHIAILGGLSVLAHVGYWSSTWVLLTALGVELTGWQAFFVLSGSAFMASLPVSLGGIGLREGTMVGILMAMDVPEAVALHAAILQRLLIFAIAIAGGLVYFSKGFYSIRSDKVTHADNSFQ